MPNFHFLFPFYYFLDKKLAICILKLIANKELLRTAQQTFKHALTANKCFNFRRFEKNNFSLI